MDLIEEVESALTHGWIKELSISVQGVQTDSESFILLSGCTGTYYQKQMAQEIALKVIQQRTTLRNEINVIP